MNAYMVSFINVDFCGLEVPSLVSGFVKEIPESSQLSQKTVERLFRKGIRKCWYFVKKKNIIWEQKRSLLKSKGLVDSLFYIVLEMLKLRLTVLKNCTENENIYKIKPGLWALKSYQKKLEDKGIVVETEKNKNSMDGSLKTWHDISITTNGIKGYKYSNENFDGTSKSKDQKGSFYVSNDGYSVTFYDGNQKENNGREQTTFICEKETGSVIMQKYSESGNTEGTWSYNVNWIQGIDNWVIVDGEENSAKLKEPESSATEYNIYKYQDIYTIPESNLGTLECKVSSSILDQMKNTIDGFSYPTETPSTYITTENFTTELTSMLNEWTGTLN